MRHHASGHITSVDLLREIERTAAVHRDTRAAGRAAAAVVDSASCASFRPVAAVTVFFIDGAGHAGRVEATGPVLPGPNTRDTYTGRIIPDPWNCGQPGRPW
jgi:hypothetical protein